MNSRDTKGQVPLRLPSPEKEILVLFDSLILDLEYARNNVLDLQDFVRDTFFDREMKNLRT